MKLKLYNIDNLTLLYENIKISNCKNCRDQNYKCCYKKIINKQSIYNPISLKKLCIKNIIINKIMIRQLPKILQQEIIL
jgi:hypothetical protein